MERMRETMQRFQSHLTTAWEQLSHFRDAIWWPFLKSSASSPVVFVVLFLLFVGAIVSTRFLNFVNLAGPTIPKISESPPQKVEIPLNCTAYEATRTRPSNYTTAHNIQDDPDRPLPPTCPDYFRWIYEDLRPWAHTGISRDTVERAKPTADFRLVIVNGKAYVETYRRSFQTRDVFTLWGILQLLQRYPGRVPDLDLMFNCGDLPLILSKAYRKANAKSPPPLFHYCANDNTLDIVFPDWSFWGWPEVNIKPWEPLLKELEEGNKKSKWVDRQPYAYWKGNPDVSRSRRNLLKCNVSKKHDWNARLYTQDWIKESQEGYKQSNLASECIHRYKIYIEGVAWSVSEKYILACDSVTLLVKSHFYDFFTRSLVPLQHYWPIKDNDKCKSIKFAVDWGNSHKKKAKSIGKAGNRFIKEELKMEYVYDYMFHLLNEYAKLLQFKPTIPQNAVEFCSESMAFTAWGLGKEHDGFNGEGSCR
ncbi:hypothetical protein L484_001075 [Morus notabilis]|uniref:Glycosyl transferase CAP10 domain-containing protein n=1 Tax=Morus notabilis TaxID=981085 RepID=W9SUG6_9ROSA|nr:hypothetical protein L484_001075 [Morus notabilis]